MNFFFLIFLMISLVLYAFFGKLYSILLIENYRRLL